MEDVDAAVAGADFLCTDVSVSTGGSAGGERVPLLRPHQVTPELMAATGPSAHSLRCHPALHDRSTALAERLHDA